MYLYNYIIFSAKSCKRYFCRRREGEGIEPPFVTDTGTNDGFEARGIHQDDIPPKM